MKKSSPSDAQAAGDKRGHAYHPGSEGDSRRGNDGHDGDDTRTGATRGGRWGRARLSLLAGGAALIVVAVLPEMRSGSVTGFGRIQMLVMAMGFVVLLAGWLGRRSLSLYRDGTVLIMNTVILLVLAEIAAGLALRSMPSEAVSAWKRSSYYDSRDWGDEYWREFAQIEAGTRYHPFVVWRRAPFHGRHIDIDADGVRRTPGTVCESGKLKVFTFGGSTMWGMGTPDWGTIPAYIANDLSQRLGGPVCVVNYAELGFVSTQSVIQLVRLLERGTVPDVVIFYEGINDAASAHKFHRAGVHLDLPRIAAKLEGSDQVHEPWFTHTDLYRFVRRGVLASRARGAAAHDAGGPRSDSLAQATTFLYLTNMRVVSVLARDYGFRYGFFWQPNMFTGAKPFSTEERELLAQTDSTLALFHRAVHRHVAPALSPERGLFDLTSLFDHDSTLIYTDGISHITPEGNRRVASAILAAMERTWPSPTEPAASPIFQPRPEAAP